MDTVTFFPRAIRPLMLYSANAQEAVFPILGNGAPLSYYSARSLAKAALICSDRDPIETQFGDGMREVRIMHLCNRLEIDPCLVATLSQVSLPARADWIGLAHWLLDLADLRFQQLSN
ncbi:hypothetical protein [Oxynema aestuarii]|uniref:Uncharacterized protein n=1 Tax=Oxynema aestuarii AP17 TaxID=2064643 RepID=A0A6H1U001_9CYAN|nr:hypothetical protein [Oxynema aestuarii]QIZ72161.1 hypothetical protein HCG48_17605 [Oxynema aestuarii AP17]RMH72202.1 MAG: hypothetical protein D6680_19780 [Cyanobacteria bacterium J007]